ncbi:MAG TPA: tripartite tricarboxylate transporter substrate binding protein [Candidatus Elarobacter sp.]
MPRILHALSLLAAALLAAPHSAVAAGGVYPSGTVRIVVGFAPGGSVDQMARYFAMRLQESLGGSFIVINRTGASGNVAAGMVARSKPDGTTLLMTSVVHSINVSLFSNLPYDPSKDFSGIAPIGYGPNAIAVNPSFPAKNLREFIAYAKAHPGQVAYADSGVGTMLNVGMELFASEAGIKLLHVPYEGTGPAIQAVIAGQVPVVSTGYGSVEQYAKSGKVRILGVATATRTSLAPGVPTFAEGANLPGFDALSWIGLMAPAGTPKSVVDTLNAAIEKVEREPSFRSWEISQGLVPYFLSPTAFDAQIKGDVVKWGNVVHRVGITRE